MSKLLSLLYFAISLIVSPSELSAEDLTAKREAMVAREIEAAGVRDARVLKVMRTTPRHEFVPTGFRKQAYLDAALPIGDRQTISPPFVVAYMTEQLNPQSTDKVLEIGTGSGYQAAVLSPLVNEVYTIEIVKRLGRRAERTLRRLDYKNVHVRTGDGYLGWPEEAPFDKIIVTCSPEDVPQPLVDQLAEGGQMIVPVGERYQQNLFRLTKRDGKLEREPLRATLFVPMTGEAEDNRQVQPDPLNPEVNNGDFEVSVGDSKHPTGWHYLRQAELATSPNPAEGKQFLRFTNRSPGEPARALQGLAIDGRSAARIKLSASVRGNSLAPGPTPGQEAAVIITFYDSRRAVIGHERLGPWAGDFDWKSSTSDIIVPLAAREAIVRLGLHGGIGTLDVDDLQLHSLPE
ncbi:protein-L-isoaspartate(D-aspartate) O-methyltransferase [Adhaeretor mobilis]|nr:protein-L-isoaspartate(D-aspartate) O-methyltransferase [Adhaeretor mobilis]